MGVVDDPYPREVAPGTPWIVHFFEYIVVIVTWVVPIIADRDQAEVLAVNVAQDVLEQGGQLRGPSRLSRLWHLPQIHRPQALATAVQYETVAVDPSFHSPWRIGTLTPSRPTASVG